MNGGIKFKIKVLTGTILLIITIFSMLTACASKKILEELKEPANLKKVEMTLWQLLRQHKKPDAFRIQYEDEWFKYEVYLKYGAPRQANALFAPLCPITKVRYIVTDKERRELVRDKILTQATCTACHPK